MTTYNTGRVQIGRCYIKPAMPIVGDMVKLQSALLDKRTHQPLTKVQQFLGGIWKWL